VGLIEYEIRTHRGTCSQHGSVTGIKPLPRLKFPIVVTAVARGAAALQPYRCPECGGRLSNAAEPMEEG
jgi:hypothetical protein